MSVSSAIVVSCASTGGGNFCDVSTLYRPEQGEVYTEKNKRWVIGHNTYGERKCGWKF
jgi:hypothetical protein